MERFKLYTYKNREEFNKYLEELDSDRRIINYNFEETREVLEQSPEVDIDVTSLVEYVKQVPANIQGALVNFKDATENTKFLIKEDLGEDALDVFHTLFYELNPIYPSKEEKHSAFNRKPFYVYSDRYEYEHIEKLCKEKDWKLISLVENMSKKQFQQLIVTDQNTIVDITAFAKASVSNSNFSLLLDQFTRSYSGFNFLVRKDFVKELLEFNYVTFSEERHISSLFGKDYKYNELGEPQNPTKVRTITSFKKEELVELLKYVNSNLFGHSNFKKVLKTELERFLILNKIGRSKVFSIFLCGATGLGKTEVGRLLSKYIGDDKKQIKINFGNHSSTGALNNLIGSPRGYIGSEDGELSKKLETSKTGVIICDEFEKADKLIFNFFLELLEDGQYTDSQGREYNLNGYIIVFTSNISKSEFYSTIPSELRSRLSLVVEFDKLSDTEKRNFVNFQVDEIVANISHNKADHAIAKDKISEAREIDVVGIDDIRMLKRKVESILFDEKE